MNLDTLQWLRSPAGQSLLVELTTYDLTERTVLSALTHLRNRYSAEYARAAVDQALLRRRARAKFRAADQLYFTREALEQASSEAVSCYRAGRFASLHHLHHVADMCCGIGSDAFALAQMGCAVTAVDRDPLRIALAEANAEVLNLKQGITFVLADVLTTPPPLADALFCDPGRRVGGRRRFSSEEYEPPLSEVLRWRVHTPALSIKLSPGIALHELRGVGAHELEFISLDGELKEATLWCGELATVERRATLLRSNLQTGDAVVLMTNSVTLTDVAPSDTPPLALPDAILYEPDPAVIRAGLVAHLATHLGAAQLDADIAYLTAPTLQETPFARAWRIVAWMPFQLKRLKARLRELEAGVVTVKKRGSPLDTDALARELGGKGKQPLVVVLTHLQGKPAALICTELL